MERPSSSTIAPAPPLANVHTPDDTLAAELRSLSVADRLRLNDSMIRTALELRAGYERRGIKR